MAGSGRAPDGDFVSGLWGHEWRLLMRSRVAAWLTISLATLCVLAVVNGLHEVDRQRAEIAKLIPLAQADLDRVRKQYATQGDPGYAAYFGFHLTMNPPAPLAFAALGQRDYSPFVLRVRALALQAQLHDSETFNPVSALAGRFDFAFVLVFLAPLFVIALFHDLFSGEREAGRWRSLASLPFANALWVRRAVIRYLLILVATGLPLLPAMLYSRVPATDALTFVAAAAGYLAFWCTLSYGLASLNGSSVVHATRLLAVWVAITVVIPVLAGLLVNRSIPADSGVDMTLAHRHEVHGAWELPREETMRKFVERHPEWAGAAALSKPFEWKWYLAFHDNADAAVAAKFHAYRDAMRARERAMRRLGWAVPPIGVQAVLHRLADTDLSAQLRYQDSISGFHARLRAHYYRFLFGNEVFNPEEFDTAPAFEMAGTAGRSTPHSDH